MLHGLKQSQMEKRKKEMAENHKSDEKDNQKKAAPQKVKQKVDGSKQPLKKAKTLQVEKNV